MSEKGKQSLTELLSPAFMARLDGLDVLSRKILQGKLQGERRSKRRGEGSEFADHRPYAIGDDLRFIDWNIYSRLDQLFLKLFLEEQDLSVHIVLDASSSMAYGEPAKDRYALKLAAALAYVGLVNNNRVFMWRFAEGLTGRLGAMRGRAYLPHMARFLLAGGAEGPSDFERCCRELTDSGASRGIMVVLSDFMFKQGYEPGLRRLVGRQYDLCLIQVLSPQELEPTLVGDLRLIDLEDADAAEVTISTALIKQYQRNLGAYCNGLKAWCHARGARHMLAATSQTAEGLVLNALRKEGLLR